MYMKIISLSSNEAGYACAVASSIKKYYKNTTKTNFFDYLVVSIKSINQVLETNNMEILRSNFTIQPTIDNLMEVKWLNYDKMISYHDLKKNDESHLENFKTKYVRRFIRILHDIYEEDVIFFIRYGELNIDELKKFYRILYLKNPKLTFFFIHVDYDEEQKYKLNEKYFQNYIYVNFYFINQKKNYHQDIYFRILEYNWEFVFKIIENNYQYNS